MSQREDMDDVRADLARTTDLAKLLFEQQFIRCGGRMPADPTWDDIDEVERDEWFDRAVDARPLIDAVEASRRDWAAEAVRLEMAAEARHCSGSSTCPADVHHEGCSYRMAGFCCREPLPTVDAGEPDENVTTCGNCGEDMDGDMLDRLRYAPIAVSRAVHPEADSEDAALLAVAEARSAADTGERHSLEEVAREFGVDLTEPSGHPEAGMPSSISPNYQQLALFDVPQEES